MIVYGEQEVSVYRRTVQMHAERPFLVVFSGTHGGADSAVRPPVPAVEAHIHEGLMGDQDRPLEAPPQPGPKRAVFILVCLGMIGQILQPERP